MDVVHAEAAGRGLAPIAVVFDRIKRPVDRASNL
jgi:hypothetical protein